MGKSVSWQACRLTMMAGTAACVVALVLAGLWFWPLLVGAVILAALAQGATWRGSGTLHGTARWASSADLAARGMLSGSGVVIGRELPQGDGFPIARALEALFGHPWERSQDACRQVAQALGGGEGGGALITLPEYQNLLCVAPTGRGKGVSFVVPLLLTPLRGSMVVLDPKGELYRLSAAARRRMGHKVARIDPFGVCQDMGEADRFNPLDLIDPGSPLVVDDARAMAEAFVVRTGDEKDPHWNDSAQSVLTAMLAMILTRFPRKDERHLGTLRELVSDPVLFKNASAALAADQGLLGRLGKQLGHFQGNEASSVLSTVARHTTFLDSHAVEQALRTSSFDAQGLLRADTTVYLILPPDQLQAQSRLLRLLVSSFIRLIGREGAKQGNECLFVLDEAAQLGYMEPLEQGLTLLRGMGLKLFFFYQSAEQARSAFRDKESLIFDNCDTQVYFGVNSFETAERVSKMLGSGTRTAESYQSNSSFSTTHSAAQPDSRQAQHGSNNSYSEMARELLKPEEVLQFPEQQAIVLTRGVPPIRLKRVRYYDDPAFANGGKAADSAWGTALAFLVAGAVAVFAALAALGYLEDARW